MPLVTLFLSFTGERFAPPPGARTLLHAPGEVRDPFLDDGKAPARVAQLYFDCLAALEAAAREVGDAADAEAMTVHRFAVPQPWRRVPARYCTYLVAYEGPADDEAAWLLFYLGDPPPRRGGRPRPRARENY